MLEIHVEDKVYLNVGDGSTRKINRVILKNRENGLRTVIDTNGDSTEVEIPIDKEEFLSNRYTFYIEGEKLNGSKFARKVRKMNNLFTIDSFEDVDSEIRMKISSNLKFDRERIGQIFFENMRTGERVYFHDFSYSEGKYILSGYDTIFEGNYKIGFTYFDRKVTATINFAIDTNVVVQENGHKTIKKFEIIENKVGDKFLSIGDAEENIKRLNADTRGITFDFMIKDFSTTFDFIEIVENERIVEEIPIVHGELLIPVTIVDKLEFGSNHPYRIVVRNTKENIRQRVYRSNNSGYRARSYSLDQTFKLGDYYIQFKFLGNDLVISKTLTSFIYLNSINDRRVTLDFVSDDSIKTAEKPFLGYYNQGEIVRTHELEGEGYVLKERKYPPKKSTQVYYFIDEIAHDIQIPDEYQMKNKPVNFGEENIQLISSAKILYIKVVERRRITFVDKLKYIFGILFTLSFPKKYWIIGENMANSNTDNGYFFAKRAYEEGIPEKFFYIYRPEKTPNNLIFDPKVFVKYNSFKHYLVYNRSEVLIVSHGDRDVLPNYYHGSNGRKNKKPLIYLQHGIVGLKKLFYHRNSYYGKMKKMIVSSEKERRIFIDKMNFRKNQFIKAGLIRYDYLDDHGEVKDSVGEKTIITVMPTWRDWLIGDEELFLESQFFKNYIELLNDEELNRRLRERNIELNVIMHVEMRLRYGDKFGGNLSNIKSIVPDNLQELFKRSSMLVTDYSSVAYDFLYMDKPVIFFQFDREDYLRNRGSFLNLYDQLFGEEVSSLSDLYDAINRYDDNDYRPLEENQRYREFYFKGLEDNIFNYTYEQIKETLNEE